MQRLVAKQRGRGEVGAARRLLHLANPCPARDTAAGVRTVRAQLIKKLEGSNGEQKTKLLYKYMFMELLDMGKISPQKLEANRRNAQLSTGPRTPQGKEWSRRNARKHGILTSALLVTRGMGWEDEDEFKDLLAGLRENLSPIGMLEELLVEKIAICCWRQRRALECEARLFQRQDLIPLDGAGLTIEKLDDARRDVDHVEGLGHKTFQEFLRLPLGPALDRVLRYETTIHRRLVYAINQLERLQRARKGEHVPAPVNVQVSSEG